MTTQEISSVNNSFETALHAALQLPGIKIDRTVFLRMGGRISFTMMMNLTIQHLISLSYFVGVMFGVNAANGAISKLALSMAVQIERTLIQTALTKGTIYPIVKRVSTALGIRMTKQVFARGVGKAVPIIGAVASGGLTFATFKTMAKRLQKHLISLPLVNIDFYENFHTSTNDDIIDLPFTEIYVNESSEEYPQAVLL